MPDGRVALFISHKVTIHGQAAQRIKNILESRTERLDAFVCEDIEAGERFVDVIKRTISRTNILLVLWPGPDADVEWIKSEIAQFESACPRGRLVVLKGPRDPFPEFLREVQIIDATKAKLQEHFLKPLYLNPKFTKCRAPLNARVLDGDIERDAEHIEAALRGIVHPYSEFYRESLIVDTSQCDVAVDGFDKVTVTAPHGCRKILNWSLKSFSWNELRLRAEEEKGKGTFWVSEMEHVVLDVAREAYPSVMTSTFRGRGSVAGLIFRPHLDQVQLVDEKKPVRFHFVFHEVLVPELVRGPGKIGDVFNILYIATRVRWEVLNPFLVKRYLADEARRVEMTEDKQRELIGQISGSLRIIDQEADRHNVVQAAINAFGDREPNEIQKVERMLADRQLIHDAILNAATRKDFEGLMAELTRGLKLNTEVLDLLASRFLELVRDDRADVLKLLGEDPTVAQPVGQRAAAAGGS